MSELAQIAPALAVSLTIDLAKGVNIVLQTHIPQNAELSFMNGMLDKLRVASDRQKAFYELEAHEFQLAHEERILQTLISDFYNVEARERREAEAWEANRHTPWERNAADEQHRLQSMEKIDHVKKMIETIKVRIEDLRQKAA